MKTDATNMPADDDTSRSSTPDGSRSCWGPHWLALLAVFLQPFSPKHNRGNAIIAKHMVDAMLKEGMFAE